MALNLATRNMVALSLMLTACGAATGLSTSSLPDARATADSTTDTGTDASVTAPCTGLHVGPTTIVSDPGESALLTAATTGDGEIFVGWQRFGSDTSVQWIVRALGLDGTPRGPTQVFAHANFVLRLGEISIAAGSHGQAAVVWDDVNGCRFAPLNMDGSILGSLGPIEPGFFCDRIGPLPTTSPAWTILSEPALSDTYSLQAIGAGGVPAWTVPLPLTGDLATRAMEPDGSFFVVWAADNLGCVTCGVHIFEQRFLADGTSVGTASLLLSDPSFGNSQHNYGGEYIVVATTATGAIVAWAPDNPLDLGAGGVQAQVLDAQGAPVGATTTLLPATGIPLAGIALAPLPGGDALLAWMTQDSLWHVLVQVVSPAGLLRGAPTLIATTPGRTDGLRVTPTPTGAMVLWEAPDRGDSGISIHATVVGCE